METGRTFLKAAVILLVFLVVADVIGVVVCTLIDVAPLRHKSSLLALRDLAGARHLLLGSFAYNAAGAWASGKAEGAARRRPNWIGARGRARAGSAAGSWRRAR